MGVLKLIDVSQINGLLMVEDARPQTAPHPQVLHTLCWTVLDVVGVYSPFTASGLFCPFSSSVSLPPARSQLASLCIPIPPSQLSIHVLYLAAGTRLCLSVPRM